MNIIRNEAGKPLQFEAGKWYAIGWENFDGQLEWHQIYQYCGDGFWTDDNGEEVTTLFDPFLQLVVGMNSADAYASQ